MVDLSDASVSRAVGASAELVFDAFLDPTALYEIFLATPRGTKGPAYVSPRVGGVFSISEQRDELISMIGKYQ